MDRLWTPWRYEYITGGHATAEAAEEFKQKDRRKGVPAALAAWPGEDRKCVFCNLIGAVDWARQDRMAGEDAERAGLVVMRGKTLYACLNAFPYASGHVLLVPYRHVDSLAKLPVEEAEEMMRMAQEFERALRTVYGPDGINFGMNLGQAAGAGVAGHLHLHALPRWFGDVNFMTATAETRVLPEALEVTWKRLRTALLAGAANNGASVPGI